MRLDLANRTLNVGFQNVLPYNWIWFDSKTGTYANLQGFETMMLLTMARFFNFTPNLIDMKDQYGYQLENGTWTGMMGEIINGNLDLGMGGVVITQERSRVMSFLYPYWIDQITFATTRKLTNEIDFDQLLAPLQWDVWLSLPISLLFLFLVQWLSHRIYFNNYNLIWVCLRLLLRQPDYRLHRMNNAIKIGTISWMMATFVLVNVYFGYFCSMLTVPFDNQINTIEELNEASQAGSVIPIVAKNHFIKKGLLDSDIPIYQAISKASRTVPTFNEGMELIILAGMKQYQSSRTFTRLINPSVRYSLIVGKERLIFSQLMRKAERYIHASPVASFFPVLITMPTCPSFVYHEPFNLLVQRMTTSGLLNYWRRRELLWTIRNAGGHGAPVDLYMEDYDYDETINVFQLSLDHLKSIFLLNAIGILVSILCFLVEILFDN